MGLFKIFRQAGIYLAGLKVLIDEEIQFAIISTPELDSQGGPFIWKLITANLFAFRIRDMVKGQNIINIDTVNDKIEILYEQETDIDRYASTPALATLLDKAHRGYVDTLISATNAGVDNKPFADTSTEGLGNITLSGEQTLNGLLTSTSRVLVVEQTSGELNGAYDSAAGDWIRAPDFDTSDKVTNGTTVYMNNAGSDKFRSKYLLVTADPIILDTTPLVFDVLPALEIGTTAGTAAEGNDSRLSDERTPIDNSATNAKLSDMGANTVKVNNTGSSADPSDLTMAPSTMLARLDSGNIVAATVAEIQTLLGIGAGTPVHSRQTLTFDATQDWDVSTGTMATLTLTANATFDAPTNLVNGGEYVLVLNTSTFDITAWAAVFKWVGDNIPVLPASSKVVIEFKYDGTDLMGVMNGGFS